MQFYVMTSTHVRQSTLVHVAKCHSTISCIMSSYFPMTGFRATVCASTVDNRYDSRQSIRLCPYQMGLMKLNWSLWYNTHIWIMKLYCTVRYNNHTWISKLYCTVWYNNCTWIMKLCHNLYMFWEIFKGFFLNFMFRL